MSDTLLLSRFAPMRGCQEGFRYLYVSKGAKGGGEERDIVSELEGRGGDERVEEERWEEERGEEERG